MTLTNSLVVPVPMVFELKREKRAASLHSEAKPVRKPGASRAADTTAPVEDTILPLVERARNGDADAYRQLVEEYQQRVYATALSIVGNPEDARDVAQDAFLKAYRNLGSFRFQSSFYTWLYRIVFNLSVDLSRRRYRHREISVGDDTTFERSVPSQEGRSSAVTSDISTPEETFSRSELGAGIQRAMSQLSPEHRAVIVLREVDGLSYSEISDAVGVSKGTVMSRLYHARRKLQKSLAEFAELRGIRARNQEQQEIVQEVEGR